MSPLERDESRRGEVVTIQASLDPQTIRTEVLEKVVEEVAGIKLEEAEVVVKMSAAGEDQMQINGVVNNKFIYTRRILSLSYVLTSRR